MPPATVYWAPVTKLAELEARKAMTLATSSALPKRLEGTSSLIAAPMWSRSLAEIPSLFGSNNGVSMGPGLTALTRMPSVASSCAQLRVSASTAALLAQYTDMLAMGWSAMMVAMLTIAPLD